MKALSIRQPWGTNKMLWQLHHQNRVTGESNVVAQKEDVQGKDVGSWVDEMQKTNPVPDGHAWMICNEESEYFMWQEDENNISVS